MKKFLSPRAECHDENVDNYGNGLEGCNSVDAEEDGAGVEGAGCCW